MPIVFELLCGREVVSVPDPAGGECNAAGDFDRLLPLENQLPLKRDVDLVALGRVEAYVDVHFTVEEMPGIVRDATALTPMAKSGPETRGLDRLRALAEHGQRMSDAIIRSRGD